MAAKIQMDMKCTNQLQELSASSFLWEICDMKDRTGAATYESADLYPSKNWEAIKWRLKFNPLGNGHAHVFLVLVESDMAALNCEIKWAFLNEDTTVIQQMANVKHRFTKVPEQYQFNPHFPTNTYLRNDKLMFHVQVAMRADIPADALRQKVKTNPKAKLPPFCLSEDLLRILLKREDGDLTLVAGGKEMLVHKTIVAARSPVLAAMLDEDKDSDKLRIPDVDFDVVGRVVQYMYTDTIADIEEMAPQLYPVACKFALLGLKAQCEKSMEKCLSVDNAVQTLVLAGRYSENLKKKIIDFMKDNAEKITSSTNFKSMASAHLQLFLDMFAAIGDGKAEAHVAA